MKLKQLSEQEYKQKISEQARRVFLHIPTRRILFAYEEVTIIKLNSAEMQEKKENEV